MSRGRQAYERRDWATACEAYARTDADGEALPAQDLEQWAFAGLWQRELDVAIGGFERAEDGYRREGNDERAALIALVLTQIAFGCGRHAEGGAAMQRAQRLLEELPECEPHALKAWAAAYLAAASDVQAGALLFEEALTVSRRVGSATGEAVALLDLGQALVQMARVEEGQTLVQEAATLALSGRVAPLAAGHVLCGTIWTHRDIGDWRAAAEWADVTWRWVEREKISIYPGVCRWHRCEVIRIRGDLETAERDAEIGCGELSYMYRPGAGYAYRELGEIRFRRGDLDGAEAAFSTALGFGVDPQPGLARLHLARGEVEAAVQGLEDALGSRGIRAVADRPYVLPVLVTAALAADDVARADTAFDELKTLAQATGSNAHRAAADQAAGEVARAKGDMSRAHELLHRAWEAWCAIEAPFEAATTRVLMAHVAEERGDAAQARTGLESARATYDRIGARYGIREVDRFLAHLRDDANGRDRRAFVFTDIVDSTRYQIALGDDTWGSLLDWHDRTLRAAFSEYGGVEVKHQGDGFFVAFDDSREALACARAIQRVLAQHRKEHGFAPEVRIGIHAGEAVARDGDYYGQAVTIAGRVAAEAGPGEVLCTLAALPQDVVAAEIQDLNLKGIDSPIATVRVPV